MIYERFKRYDLRHFWDFFSSVAGAIEWNSIALIRITFLMDVIKSISTYSTPNWLCNDLTEMANQLNDEKTHFCTLAEMQNKNLFACF